MNEKEVDVFLKLQPQLKSAYDEISLLSKKKPTESVNTFKLKFINSIITRANKILGNKYQPFPDEFEVFSEDDMPNNSDVVFILSHYLTSLEKSRSDNIAKDTFGWYWKINGKTSNRKTDPPRIK